MSQSKELLPLLDALKKLSEAELQRRFIIPLLQKWGHKVIETSGQYEGGKDLVSEYKGGGVYLLCAHQIKNQPISGNAGHGTSFGALLEQVRQMRENPIPPPIGNWKYPTNVFVFNPYEIPQLAYSADSGRAEARERDGLHLYTGLQLLEQLEKHCLNELQKLDDSAGYLTIAREHDRINESAAFPGAKEFLLSYIYVEAEFAFLSSVEVLIRALLPRISETPALKGRGKKEEKEQTNREAVPWLPMSRTLRPAQPLNLDDPASDALTLLINFCYSLRQQWSSSEKGSRLQCDLDSALTTMCILQRNVRVLLLDLQRSDVTVRSTKEVRTKLETLHKGLIDKDFNFSVSRLAGVRHPILVLGRAGAGKTSLLRMLYRWISQADPKYPPVMLRAIDIEQGDINGIFKQAVTSFQKYEIQIPKLKDEVLRGTRALIIDGLDEAKSNQVNMLKKCLPDLQKANPKLRLIVSSRDSIDFRDWNAFLPVMLQPFSDAQLEQYIKRYFVHDVEAAEGLETFLFSSDGSALREICRTPMVAFLLCSLYQAGADLPTTEVELYQRRFELLLGRWEHAKGIAPMPAQQRRDCETTLRRFAFFVHDRGAREFSRSEFLEVARRSFLADGKRTVVSMFEDLISRGVFEVEEKNRFSFGHLTYQEFLCAEYFFYFAKVPELAKRFGEKQWRKVLFFWAAMVQDIDVLKQCLNSEIVLRNRDQIRELLRIARLSSWDPLGDHRHGPAKRSVQATQDQVLGFRMRSE